jgi:two-component system, chemotaxis family, chemotaxis protein CheY
MRKLVADALTSGRHEVIGEAKNGTEAVELFQTLRPDITTMDITMPDKDGLTALSEIMTIDPTARVVMCSALGQQGKAIQSIKLGAKQFITKPFQAEKVLEAISNAPA